MPTNNNDRTTSYSQHFSKRSAINSKPTSTKASSPIRRASSGLDSRTVLSSSLAKAHATAAAHQSNGTSAQSRRPKSATVRVEHRSVWFSEDDANEQPKKTSLSTAAPTPASTESGIATTNSFSTGSTMVSVTQVTTVSHVTKDVDGWLRNSSTATPNLATFSRRSRTIDFVDIEPVDFWSNTTAPVMPRASRTVSIEDHTSLYNPPVVKDAWAATPTEATAATTILSKSPGMRNDVFISHGLLVNRRRPKSAPAITLHSPDLSVVVRLFIPPLYLNIFRKLVINHQVHPPPTLQFQHLAIVQANLTRT